jgi:hypothetical protein
VALGRLRWWLTVVWGLKVKEAWLWLALSRLLGVRRGQLTRELPEYGEDGSDGALNATGTRHDPEMQHKGEAIPPLLPVMGFPCLWPDTCPRRCRGGEAA